MKGGFSLLGTYAGKDIEEMDFKQTEDPGKMFSFGNMITYINETLNILINRDLMDKTLLPRTHSYFSMLYLRIFNNPKTFFNENVLDRDENILKFLFSSGVSCLVVGTVDSGIAFPVFEHTKRPRKH